MNSAVIGLGSNIDPKENIAKALNILNKNFSVKKKSSFVETEPVGFSVATNFINGAVLIETPLGLEDLKIQLHKFESDMGRTQTQKSFTSRIIDLDIVVFNDKIIDQDIYKRDFLKKSVLEVLPALKV